MADHPRRAHLRQDLLLVHAPDRQLPGLHPVRAADHLRHHHQQGPLPHQGHHHLHPAPHQRPRHP